jgi:hypothetical protein
MSRKPTNSAVAAAGAAAGAKGHVVPRLPFAGEPVAQASFAEMPDGDLVREYTLTSGDKDAKDVLAFPTVSSIPFSAHRFEKVQTGTMQWGRAMGPCLDCGIDIKDTLLLANKCFGPAYKQGHITVTINVVEDRRRQRAEEPSAGEE